MHRLRAGCLRGVSSSLVRHVLNIHELFTYVNSIDAHNSLFLKKIIFLFLCVFSVVCREVCRPQAHVARVFGSDWSGILPPKTGQSCMPAARTSASANVLLCRDVKHV